MYEQQLGKFSRIGCALRGTWPACALSVRARVKRGHHQYDYEVTLCDNPVDLPRASLYGALLPFVAFHVCRLLFRPWWEPVVSRLFVDENRKRHTVDPETRERAQQTVEIMRRHAERIREDEERKSGLVVQEAKYGLLVAPAGTHPSYRAERCIDVTVPLQTLISDSKLLLHSVSKSQLPGFYDPCPGEPKLLRVRYSFRGKMHMITIKDHEPLFLPKMSHLVAREASFEI